MLRRKFKKEKPERSFKIVPDIYNPYFLNEKIEERKFTIYAHLKEIFVFPFGRVPINIIGSEVTRYNDDENLRKYASYLHNFIRFMQSLTETSTARENLSD